MECDMTRINVVPVEELHNKHLLGEYKEITRVYALVRKAQESGRMKSLSSPVEYTMGKGHVLFFYRKLGYISKRYQQLTQEMLKRGYKPSPISLISLEGGIDRRYFSDYLPTEKALDINRQRIRERLVGMGVHQEGI
jgi:deoxyribonuclease (pyrimidine dimer)